MVLIHMLDSWEHASDHSFTCSQNIRKQNNINTALKNYDENWILSNKYSSRFSYPVLLRVYTTHAKTFECLCMINWQNASNNNLLYNSHCSIVFVSVYRNLTHTIYYYCFYPLCIRMNWILTQRIYIHTIDRIFTKNRNNDR